MTAQEQKQETKLELVEGRNYILFPQKNIFRYVGRKGLTENYHTFIREITSRGVRGIEMYNFLDSDLRKNNNDLETGHGPTNYVYEDGRYYGENEKLKFAELVAILSEPSQEAQKQ